MLEPILKEESYYLDKLSMFLRGCNGVPEQFSMLITILDELDDVYDDITSLLDITKDSVFVKLCTAAQSTVQGEYVDILTKLGNLYGVYQNFKLSFINDNQQREEHEVNLTPFEFWLLIKSQILQNCFDGSYSQTREYYDKMKLPVYIFTDAEHATAYVVLNTTVDIEVEGRTPYDITNNIVYLFNAGFFTIKSMGITYKHSTIDLETLGIWDANDWDDMKWGL